MYVYVYSIIKGNATSLLQPCRTYASHGAGHAVPPLPEASGFRGSGSRVEGFRVEGPRGLGD